ncbi:replication-associated recombination protein A [Zavarzinella formosa]|uniref:replication-associated recombination protein A n=1 Tax=Zavarzinella formosa TaxID=360055 RepID=UPI0002FFB687|nr:replication-associated recombination protein A [Zavarzinella formosa]
MRPRSIDEFIGQEHFIGPGKLLRRMLLADRLNSLIFYGPPGTGKTALAQVIAHHTKSRFQRLNAVSAASKEVREVLEAARTALELHGERTILFIDEIHRFNKTQQDILLPDVESGVVILVGATTENPFFAINSPLLSRSQIFTFEPLSKDHIRTIIRRALADTERGLGELEVHLHDDAMEFLATASDGDARRALTALEIGVRSCFETPIELTLEVVQESIQRKLMSFDPTGDTHYDLASALIKSLRGSDPDAAIYWLARMLESGEDPRFIARRMVIMASEDVGNADPRGLLVAQAAWDSVERVGLPECQLALSQAAIYLATAPKSNSATMAIITARKEVREGRTIPVPKHLRDAHYAGAAEIGHGKGYQYAHDYEGGYVAQDYLGVDRTFYTPTDRGYEVEIKQRMDELKKRREEKK